MSPDALHMVAGARGVARGPSSNCVVCGPSPFPVGRPVDEMITSTFSDREWIANANAEYVCAGCVSLLSGRPGDDPPPMRTMHAIAVPGEPLRALTPSELGDAILNPHQGDHVLVWATSRQRHAVLRAGVSRPGRLLIGADDGVVEVLDEHRPIAEAVMRLLAGFRRDAVCSGQYPANQVAAYGAARWRDDDALVVPHRGALLVDLFCATLPKGETTNNQEEPMLQASDRDAVEVLTKLALASDMRANDGITFWRAAFLHRIRRYSTRPIGDFVARVGADISVRATSAPMLELIQWLGPMPANRLEAISTAIRERSAMLVGVAFLNVRSSR
jgi:hypothetical protein